MPATPCWPGLALQMGFVQLGHCTTLFQFKIEYVLIVFVARFLFFNCSYFPETDLFSSFPPSSAFLGVFFFSHLHRELLFPVYIIYQITVFHV